MIDRYTCTHPTVTVELTPQGPNYGRRVCSVCGSFRGWEPKPMTRERAAEMVLPFGKHSGTKLGEVPRDYLEWMARGFSIERYRQAARCLLEAP